MYSVREHNRSLSELGLAIGGSLLLHIIGVVLLMSQTPPRFQDEAIVIEVDLAPPPQVAPTAPPPKQLVSDSEQATKPIPPDFESRFEASRDSVVEREQIQRGLDPLAGRNVSPVREQAVQPPSEPVRAPDPQEQQRAPKPVKSKATDAKGPAREPAPAKLRLEDPMLLKEFTEGDLAGAPKPTQDERSSTSTAGYKAFSRPPGSGAAFLGARGVPDYIPSLPDGDITLLNAKANRFAVFVRRVATQVFGQLRASGWEALRANDVNGIRDFSEVRATISLKGELLAVEITDQSGSRRFDEVVYDSVKRGVRDPNPPKDAVAPDGNIHFIFRSRSWVEYGGSPRSGAPIERRWLLLATGLE